jgi:uncharacterized membrane protein YccC
VRVAVAAIASYALWALLRLPQGYWASITAVLIVQTSVGGALAASRDRLIGTFAGAIVGAAATLIAPRTALGEGLALGAAVLVLAVAAAKKPSLKIGPVTATVVILAGGRYGSPAYAALRVGEIMLGSMIGIATTLIVFPARARNAAIARAGVVLSELEQVFGLHAEAVAKGEPAQTTDLNARTRVSLAALEAAVAEAVREERAHLASRAPEALPRTLWRLRNDSVFISRALSRPLPPGLAERLSAPTHALMRAVQAELRGCAEALAAGTQAPPAPVRAAAAAFREAFGRVREDWVPRGVDFEEIGHVFGLAWAVDGLERNLADLADRTDEAAGAPARAPRL